MKTDYIIVGGGLAGLCFAAYCRQNNKSFILIDSIENSKSSLVAVGLFNPIILKRFTAIWNANYQVNLANHFYTKQEEVLKSKFFHYVPLYRKFANVEEQNNWFAACDKATLREFLTDKIIYENINGIDATLGYGEVHQSGYLDTQQFVRVFHHHLANNNQLQTESFDYTLLQTENNKIVYKDITAAKIIFAEGFSMHNNPYFNQLPLDGTKGEVLTVRIPDLKSDVILKSNIFVLPIGNDLYRVGATYDWEDKDDKTTEEGKNQLLSDLKELTNLPFDIVEHKAGIRPTVRDRRPLVGTHYKHQNIHLLNGLGTRGVLLGPYLAEQLFNHLENNTDLPKEIDINRYYKKQNLI